MCAFTPLVPPSTGHTSSPPNPSRNAIHRTIQIRDGGICLDSSSLRNISVISVVCVCLPDSITTANRRHVTPQTEKTNEVKSCITEHHDMGLRTVYQSRYPKIDCHPLFVCAESFTKEELR
ncbi:hypothetical protein TNCV_124731 [Trichonephila clavipes]|nr:hypothetical protein TNCV_124731 [Trichonephila clavipes]